MSDHHADDGVWSDPALLRAIGSLAEAAGGSFGDALALVHAVMEACDADSHGCLCWGELTDLVVANIKDDTGAGVDDADWIAALLMHDVLRGSNDGICTAVFDLDLYFCRKGGDQ